MIWLLFHFSARADSGIKKEGICKNGKVFTYPFCIWKKHITADVAGRHFALPAAKGKGT